MSEHRTVFKELHPDNLIEGNIYEIAYRPSNAIRNYVEMEVVVFKGMTLPTVEHNDSTLVLTLKLTRKTSKGMRKIFRVQWSQVVGITYLHAEE